MRVNQHRNPWHAKRCLQFFMFLSSTVRILCHGMGTSQARYFSTPMHEIMQSEVYLKVNQYNEIFVAYAGKDTDLRSNDYITHADGIRVLSGGLEEFLESGEEEVLVPVVDDALQKQGGYKLTGFVMLQAAHPRKLFSRRGEVVFDLEEGGPAPSMKLGG